MKKIKDINYYLGLKWTFITEVSVDNNNRPIYVTRVKELPGVMTDGYSLQEVQRSIKEAMILAFEMYLENGEEIPEAKQTQD